MVHPTTPRMQINGHDQSAPAKSPVMVTTHTMLSPGRNVDFEALHRRESRNVDMDDYFHGPIDLEHHSKWPMFLRLHGSVLPKMIVPLTFVAIWSTAITCIAQFVYDLGINSVLLTVLGFVVGLSLSFRSSTAYERYNEGRKYWALLQNTCRNIGRLIWIHAAERHNNPENPDQGKQELLAKMTALNLLNAFAVSLKHRLRFEPSTDYPDLEPLISHLDTFASRADKTVLQPRRHHIFKAIGTYLGLPFVTSNPRKLMKMSKDNLGNLPLEIIEYLASYMEGLFETGQLKTPAHQSTTMGLLASLTDVVTGTERILNTPLPVAYNIAISQITWVYVLVLPFQLHKSLGWITIPGTVVAAYIILGIATIGREIENPFGEDVNDLPLDDYCRMIAADLDALMSCPRAKPEEWIETAQNKVLYPLSMTDYYGWQSRSVEQIRDALRTKATTKSSHVMSERVKTAIDSDLLEV